MSSSERTSAVSTLGSTGRATLVAQTLVELSDTLEDDFDIISFANRLTERCVELLGVNEAGLVISDPTDGLQVLASSSEETRLVELIEVQVGDGPCPDAYRLGHIVAEDDLCAPSAARWPKFTPAALAAGFRSAYAVPLQRRQHQVGALNLFSEVPGGLHPDDRPLAQALADTAVIAILQQRSRHDHQRLTEQLQRALDSRIVLEQAKGIIAQQAHLGPDDAFPLLRDFARRCNRRLTDVAKAVIAGEVSACELMRVSPPESGDGEAAAPTTVLRLPGTSAPLPVPPPVECPGGAPETSLGELSHRPRQC